MTMIKPDLPWVSKMRTRPTQSASTGPPQPQSTLEQPRTHFQVLFTIKKPPFAAAISWPTLSQATCDCTLATSVTMSLTNTGSFNLPRDLRISVAQAKTLPRISTPFEVCNSVGTQMIALTTALSGYMPFPRCYSRVSQAAGKANDCTNVDHI